MREASLGRLRPRLPNEPCLHLPAAERALTERHLLPALPALEAFFLAVRLQLDPELEVYCRKNTKPSVSSHKTLFFRELSSANTVGFFVLKPENLLQNLYANLH